MVEVRTVERLGAAFQCAVIDQGGRQFALVPGGDVTVGFDLDRWQPTPEQLESYQAELTSDPSAVRGGDGGEAECGGYGTLVTWLALATANRNPAMAEFLHGDDGESMYEDFSTRPVLDLN
ncbi:hypothetical protein P3T37_000175 [Kitasatospora sp. MAA4]|nr:hypothetical protein [Kitasatospora sp. MAA4]